MGSTLRPVSSLIKLIGSGSKGSTTARFIVFCALNSGKILLERTTFSETNSIKSSSIVKYPSFR